MLRWALGIGLGLVVLLITVLGAVFALADHYDLAPLAARHLAISLERKVTIGSLHVTPGRWLHVELRDFHLANLPGGTQPVMATMISASAEIDALSLLYGPIVVRRLMVNGLQILLEHTSDDRRGSCHRGRPAGADSQPCSTHRLRATWCSGPRVANRSQHMWIGFTCTRRRQTNPSGSTGWGRITVSRSGWKPIWRRSMRSAMLQCRALLGFTPPRATLRCNSRAQ